MHTVGYRTIMSKAIVSFCSVGRNGIFQKYWVHGESYPRVFSWSISSPRALSNDRQGTMPSVLSGVIVTSPGIYRLGLSPKYLRFRYQREDKAIVFLDTD